MTCDVEEFSIEHSTINDAVIPKVHKQGLPLLLDIFEKEKINATFFFTGYYAERSPESLLMVQKKGHEIGCHSYSHDSKLYLNKLSAKEQYREIRKAKSIIEEIVGPIKSFRSPALRSNKYTFEKFRWLQKPRIPFKIRSSIQSKYLTEIPLTSLVIPYMSNISRISPSIMEILQKFMFNESLRDSNHLLFLTHPNEFVELIGRPKTTYRSDYLLGKIFTDYLRHKLNLQRFGPSSVFLVEKEIKAAKKLGCHFKTISSINI